MGTLVGPTAQGSRPNSRELVDFGGAPSERPSIEGSNYSIWGASIAPEVIGALKSSGAQMSLHLRAVVPLVG